MSQSESGEKLFPGRELNPGLTGESRMFYPFGYPGDGRRSENDGVE